MTKTVEHLFIYPIKSLPGIEVGEAEISSRGLAYDRRFMLVDEAGKFLTQRELPGLALFKCEWKQKAIVVRATGQPGLGSISFTIQPSGGKLVDVVIWDDICKAELVSEDVDVFFSKCLKSPVRLVYMPEESKRVVDTRYNFDGKITAFSDGYPILVIGTASLADLNSRIKENGSDEIMSWNRFRPNIVVNTQIPYEEDDWKTFEISGIDFKGVKRCARCVITTMDPSTGISGKEPLRTLAKYRNVDQKVYFGQNVSAMQESGILMIGDVVTP